MKKIMRAYLYLLTAVLLAACSESSYFIDCLHGRYGGWAQSDAIDRVVTKRDTTMVPELINILERNNVAGGSRQVAKALAALGDTRAIVPLIGKFSEVSYTPLEQDKLFDYFAENCTFMRAVIAFGPKAHPYLLKALSNNDNRIKSYSARALLATSYQPYDKQDSITLQRARLCDSEMAIRRQAAAELENLGYNPTGDKDIWLWMVAHDDYADLANIGQPVLPFLWDTFNSLNNETDTSIQARKNLILTIGIIGDQESLPKLQQIRTSRVSITLAVLVALSKYRDDCPLDFIASTIDKVNRGNPAVTLISLHTLYDHNYYNLKETLSRVLKVCWWLKGGCEWEERYAVELLAACGDSSSVKQLVPYLANGDIWLRAAAANTLKKLHYTPATEEETESMLAAMKDYETLNSLQPLSVQPLVDYIINSHTSHTFDEQEMFALQDKMQEYTTIPEMWLSELSQYLKDNPNDPLAPKVRNLFDNLRISFDRHCTKTLGGRLRSETLPGIAINDCDVVTISHHDRFNGEYLGILVSLADSLTMFNSNTFVEWADGTRDTTWVAFLPRWKSNENGPKCNGGTAISAEISYPLLGLRFSWGQQSRTISLGYGSMLFLNGEQYMNWNMSFANYGKSAGTLLVNKQESPSTRHVLFMFHRHPGKVSRLSFAGHYLEVGK